MKNKTLTSKALKKTTIKLKAQGVFPKICSKRGFI